MRLSTTNAIIFYRAFFYLGNFVNLFIDLHWSVIFFVRNLVQVLFTEVAIEKYVITLVVLWKAVLDCSCFEAVVRILEK